MPQGLRVIIIVVQVGAGLVWVPVISLSKIFIPSYMFDGLWWQKQTILTPQVHEETLQIPLKANILSTHFQQPCKVATPHDMGCDSCTLLWCCCLSFFVWKGIESSDYSFQDMAIQRVCFKYLFHILWWWIFFGYYKCLFLLSIR